ncbi:MAG: hypothetical protein HZR80_10225 [Candidatus Heimdallarchaeota archaeon]
MVNSNTRLKHFQSKLRKVKDGIKPKSLDGTFGNTWWSKRWLQSLEYLENDKRIVQGRYYAKEGQIKELAISKGLIQSKVQGTKIKPYTVTIKLEVLSEDQWKAIFKEMAQNSLVLSNLLMNNFPSNIEELFNRFNFQLFPGLKEDLTAACNCSDWANPCKHTAAVYYILADMFEENPFLIFHLRGKSRLEFIEVLKQFIDLQAIEKERISEATKGFDIKKHHKNERLKLDNFWQRKSNVRLNDILDLLRSTNKHQFDKKASLLTTKEIDLSRLLIASYEKTQNILKSKLHEVLKD